MFYCSTSSSKTFNSINSVSLRINFPGTRFSETSRDFGRPACQVLVFWKSSRTSAEQGISPAGQAAG